MMSAVHAAVGAGGNSVPDGFDERLTSIVDHLSADIFVIAASAMSISLIVLGFVLLPETNRAILDETGKLGGIIKECRAFVNLWVFISAGAIAMEAFVAHWPYRFRNLIWALIGVVLSCFLCKSVWAGLVWLRRSKNAHPIVKFQIGLILVFFFGAFVLAGMWTQSMLRANGASSYMTLDFLILFFASSLFLIFFFIGFELLEYMSHHAASSDPGPEAGPPGGGPFVRRFRSVGRAISSRGQRWPGRTAPAGRLRRLLARPAAEPAAEPETEPETSRGEHPPDAA